MANKNGIAGSSDDHAQHGEPDIGQALRGLATVTDAQHVAHRFEHGEGVELGPGVVLQGDKKKSVKDGRCEGERGQKQPHSNIFGEPEVVEIHTNENSGDGERKRTEKQTRLGGSTEA